LYLDYLSHILLLYIYIYIYIGTFILRGNKKTENGSSLNRIVYGWTDKT